MTYIHPSAIVDAKAEIADDCSIAPYAIIGPEVTLGSGCKIMSHTVISGKTTIGKNNTIFNHAVIGGIPQDKKFANEEAELEIGDNNLIREYVTINTGTAKDYRGITKVGNNNWIMTHVHLAHNCHLGDHIVLVNNVQVAGHVEIGDHAVIGASCGIHQFCKIGAHVMVAAHSAVLRDVPPFVVAGGQPAKALSINLIGLKRRDFDDDRIASIRDAFRTIYRRGLTPAEAISHLQGLPDEDSQLFYTFLSDTKRNIVTLKSSKKTGEIETDEDN